MQNNPITEIKRLEEALRECQEKCSTLFAEMAEHKKNEEVLKFQARLLDNVHDAISAVDENHIVTYWNDMAEKMFGFSAEEVLGNPLPIRATIMGSSRDQAIAKMINDGFYVGEAIYHHKNGTPVYTIVHAKTFEDSQGAYKGNISTFRDITKQKQTEEAVHESERKYRELLKHAPSGIYEIDFRKKRFLTVNDVVCQLTGYSREELLEMDPMDVLDEKSKIDFQARINQWLKGEKPDKHVDYKVLTKDGRELYASLNVTFINDEDGIPQGATIVGQDITERKKAEKELQESQKQALELVEKLNRAGQNKNEFISVLSHELRNPLASVMMGITVLDQTAPGSEEAIQAREIIKRQTDHLSHLVDELLDVTRITQNKMRLKKERFELNHLVDQVVQDYRLQFDGKEIELKARLNADPVYLEADRARLTQAVGNLLTNANKFTDAGGRTLVTVETDPNNQEAVIKIEDNGRGIDPNQISDLFEPFMQVDNSLDRSHSGLGMGLSIVKGIAILHGGSAAAFSEGLGRGTQFTIRLPLSFQEVQNIPEQEAPVVEEQLSAMSILVIDDMPTITKLLSIMLKNMGHEVIIAHSGPEGIAIAREFNPEIIFCDIGMPGMDGYDVAREIRSDERLKNAYLIALSGYAQDDDLKSSIAAGFDRHLAKPLRMAVLKSTLAEYVAEKSG
jgi:PAS domain S-box-containing protein